MNQNIQKYNIVLCEIKWLRRRLHNNWNIFMHIKPLHRGFSIQPNFLTYRAYGYININKFVYRFACQNKKLNTETKNKRG